MQDAAPESAHGWTRLFHDCLLEQLRKLQAAAKRAESQDPHGFESNANVKLLTALSHLMLEVIPTDPNRDAYRLGNTLGTAHKHWRRAKIGLRFRLFFRFDSSANIIVFAWVNDEQPCAPRAANMTPMQSFKRC